MIKKSAFALGLMGVLFSSCIEHEVIPAPTPEVELNCSFEGNIGGAFVQYTENVNGYSCFPSISKQTSGGITSAQYLFSMRSATEIPYVQIGLGSISWDDPTGTEIPALSLFNSFFATYDLPNYSDYAYNGFEVAYVDAVGDVWRSSEVSVPQDVEFELSSIKQESDVSGDYSKFICNFNCFVYHTYSVVDITVVPQTTPPTMTDSVASMFIDNAIYQGFFKR